MTKKIFTLAAVSAMFLSYNASAMEPGGFFLKAGAGYSVGNTNFKSSGSVGDTPISLVSNNKIKNIKGAAAEVGRVILISLGPLLVEFLESYIKSFFIILFRLGSKVGYA